MHRLTNNSSQSSVGFFSSCFPLPESLWQNANKHKAYYNIFYKKKTKKTTNCLKHQWKPNVLPCSKFLHTFLYMYIKDRNSAKSLHLHKMNVFHPLTCTIPRREGELQVGLQTVGWTAVVSGCWMLADLGHCHLLVVTLQFAFGQQVVCGCYMIVQVSVYGSMEKKIICLGWFF